METMDLYQVTSAALTHPGRKRSNNEDFVIYFEPVDMQELHDSGCLYIVADGVGGASKGERASKYAAQKVLYDYYQRLEAPVGERLDMLMRQANADIHNYALEHYERMATTMVAAVIRQNKLLLANAGDSRAYIIREDKIKQVTHDHNYVGEMVRRGELTEDEAINSKVKNRLTRSLGGEPQVRIDVFPEIAVQPGDKILLCSDGLTRYADSQDILKMVNSGRRIEEIVGDLVDFANQQGGADNTSVILVEIKSALINTMPTIKRSADQRPQPANWEIIDTEPGPREKAENWWSKIIDLPPRYFYPILFVFVLGLFAIIIGIVLLLMYPKQPSLNSPTDNNLSAKTTQTLKAVSLLQPTAQPTMTITDTPEPTKTALPSPSATATSVSTPIPVENLLQGQVQAGGSIRCIFEVPEGGSLQYVLSQFDLISEVGKEYLYFENCELKQDVNNPRSFVCKGEPIPFFRESTIHPGWWIVIPGITSREDCNVSEAKYIIEMPE